MFCLSEGRSSHLEAASALSSLPNPPCLHCHSLPSNADCYFGQTWQSSSRSADRMSAVRMTCFADAWSLDYDYGGLDADSFSDYYPEEQQRQGSDLCRRFLSVADLSSYLHWSYAGDGMDYKCFLPFSAVYLGADDMAGPNLDKLPQSLACGQSPRPQFEMSV